MKRGIEMDNNMQSLKAAEWNAPEPTDFLEEPAIDISEREEQIVERQSERFEIKDDATANWAFQRLADIEAIRVKKMKKYQIYIDQANEWKKREVGVLEDKASYLRSLIEAYRLTKPDKKVSVPAGKVVIRHSNEAIYDDGKLLDFARINYPSLIKTEYTVKKGELKKNLSLDGNGHYVDENGQIVSGMSYEPVETVTYKVN